MLLLVKPQKDCPLSWLSEECIYYILNMCHWTWASKTFHDEPQRPLARVGRRLGGVLSRLGTLSKTLIGYS